jgi:hypothetical protein
MVRLALLLWLFLIEDSDATLGELGYTMEKYDESPGIYYENKPQVNLYNTDWKTVVYVNLGKLCNQSNGADQYIQHVNKLCQETSVQNWTDCYHFREISADKMFQVKKTERLIFEIADHKIGTTRKKRGVFNFIGEISIILFGTMDDDDARYYNEQIKHFEENSDDIPKLMK